MDSRLDRIRKEVAALARHYGTVEWDDEHGTWALIRAFPLPKWIGARSSLVLVRMPDSYPLTPPKGCYLDARLPIPSHYQESTSDLSHLGWAWFCLHLESGWRPTGDIWTGDNLMTVAAALSAALTGVRERG